AEITRDVPGEEIAWTSVEGSDVVTAGCVRFTPDPAGRGTLVELQMSYAPPLGVVGALAAKMLGEDPEAQIREGLRRFKRMLETGEIPTTEGQPSGRKREHLAARQGHAAQRGRAHGVSHGEGIRWRPVATTIPTPGSRTFPGRRPSTRATPTSASPRARSAARTCTSTPQSSRPCRPGTSWATSS